MKTPVGGGGQSPKKKVVKRKTTAPVTDAQSSSYPKKTAPKSASGVKGGTNAAEKVVRKPAVRSPLPPSGISPVRFAALQSKNFTQAGGSKALAAANRPIKVAGVEAPILGILEQTTRPLHSVAGAFDALHPQDFTKPGYKVSLSKVAKQAKEGLIDNKPYTFGKILKKAGLPNWAAGVGGFVFDVAADPTTYLTFGAGSVAHKAAEEAGQQVFKKALSGGMTEAGARTVAKRAAEKAANKAAPGHGLTIRFGPAEIPGVRKATAKATRGVKKVVAKTPGPVKRAGGGAKNIIGDVRPQMRRAGVEEAEHLAVRRAGARVRGQGAQGMASATRRARAARKVIPKDQYEAVIDAIEKGQIRKLPEELRDPAIHLRAELRHAKRVRRQAGIGEGEIGGKTVRLGPVPSRTVVKSREVQGQAFDPRATEKALLRRAEKDHPEAVRELREVRGQITTIHMSDTGYGWDKLAGLEQRESELLKRIGVPRDLWERARTTRVEKSVETIRGTKRGRLTRTDVVTRNAGTKGYFPHGLADELHAGQGVHETVPAVGSKGVRKVTLGSSKKRRDLRPLSEQNPERLAAGETPFSTNLPLVYGNYLADTAKAVAAKHLATSLKAAGRPFRNGIALHPEDVVFHYHNGDLTPLKKIPETAPKAGQYVVLNRTAVEREFANIAPQFDRTHIGALFDKGTAAFKRIATFTPGFHARNIVGDTQMAYLTQPGHKIPGNLKESGRAVRRLSGVERAEERGLGKVPADTRRVKLRKTPKDTLTVAGKPIPVDAFLEQAKREGVVRSGYIGRELREQGHGVGKGYKRIGGRVSRAGHSVNRWMQNREDVVRLSTFKHGLDKGLTPDQAADLARNTHIDYGDLTKFERVGARRAMPFYTFSARALPIHAKALGQRPGKFANYQKLREEGSLAGGVDLDRNEKYLKSYQARQAPLILNINGEKTVLSDALPLTLLNELPTGEGIGAYVTELAQWIGQLTNPIIKDPVEYYANRSFFFRNDIQPKDYPLVNAPAWVKLIYQTDRGLAESLGITPNYLDRHTGKKTWGWYGKADYVFKSIPGIPLFVQQMTQTSTRRGQSKKQRALGFLTGVRAEPLDPAGAIMESLFKERDALDGKIGALNQQAKSPKTERALIELRAKQHEIERQINALSKERGDKKPLYPDSAGAKDTARLEVQLALLRAKREQMKADGSWQNELGYYTPQWVRLGDKIKELQAKRDELRGTKKKVTIRPKTPPKTTGEKQQDRLDEQLQRLENPDKDLEDKLNRQLERLRVLEGGG